ncbi:hypothetical protein CFP71_10065 [Amycolatopsis thailandensis]|uniref:Uncharacterized protein n=1 Tax=Amycolatopsis thailandensis TaxID=589330 RepID=A0A229SE80_9PSEU|nr:hypothetical protein [Amycolatopsis thailandensis]OXM57071.1 hypothetical protein CFP71_10065 [Amycolatopsis thailandensis]
MAAQRQRDTGSTRGGAGRGQYRVRLDYTTKCAHILDSADDDRVVEAYGPGVVRATVADVIAAGGWVLTSPVDSDSWSVWVDGREHPVHRR